MSIKYLYKTIVLSAQFIYNRPICELGGEFLKHRNKANVIFVLSVLFMAFLISVPFLCGAINKTISNTPDFVEGKANFSDTRTNRNRAIYLSGEWLRFEGYIITENAELTGSFVQIPPSFSTLSTSNESNGCNCSYMMSIKGLDLKNAIVYIPNFAGVYQVFINGELVTQSGSFTESKISANMELDAIPVQFESDKEYNIIIEVTCELMPGIYMNPVIADYSFTMQFADIAKSTRSFIFGIVFFLGFFILFYSIKNHNLFSSKWLPLLCFLVAIRMMISTEGYSAFRFLFATINYEQITLLICMSTFIIKLVSLLFYSDTLDMNISKKTFIAVSLSTVLCTIITTIFPSIFFNPYYYIIIQSATLPLDIILINHLADSVARKVPYSTAYLFGYIALVSGIMIDCCYTNGLIPFASSYFMPVLFTVFILIFTNVFFDKISKIHEASLRAAELDKELHMANTAVMISQIQPHFLYNALNTIKYLIKRDPKSAEKAVISFSKYLRGNMESITQKTPIPFKEELEHIKNYCDIELLRFGDKIEIIYDTEFVEFNVPSLTIQPLVENAIKHGVTKKAEGGTVKISTKLLDDYYYIIIEDDGIGFDPQNPDYTPDDNHAHVGLSNVTNRLKTMVNAKIVIDSQIDVGTKITIKIPKGE